MRRHTSQLGMSALSVCAIVGGAAFMLSAVAPAYMRTLRFSKLSEATDNLSQLYAASSAYFEREFTGDEGALRGCLPDPAGPTPREPSVEPRDVRFGAGSEDGAATWNALKFQPNEPVRYRYSYQSLFPGCEGTTHEGAEVLRLSAEGDLDGDGVRSMFQRRATVRGRSLYPLGVLQKHRPIE